MGANKNMVGSKITTGPKGKIFGPRRKLKKLIAPTRNCRWPKRKVLHTKRLTKVLHRRKINYYSKRWRLHRSGLERIPTYNTTLLQFRRDYDRLRMDQYLNCFVDRYQRIKPREMNCLSSSAQRKIKKLVRRQRILAIRSFRETITRGRWCMSKKEKNLIIRKHRWKDYHQTRAKNQGAPVKRRNSPDWHKYPPKKFPWTNRK
jgi:ribosomal protein S18